MTVRGATSAPMRTMRARVLAPVDSGLNPYGHSRQESMPIRYDDIACYAWAATEQAETFTENTQGAITVIRIICARDLDIDNKCVVESVYDKRGSLVFAGPMRVIGVTRRAEHMVVTTRAAKAGRA